MLSPDDVNLSSLRSTRRGIHLHKAELAWKLEVKAL
jgi:hypothetical protein